MVVMVVMHESSTEDLVEVVTNSAEVDLATNSAKVDLAINSAEVNLATNSVEMMATVMV